MRATPIYLVLSLVLSSALASEHSGDALPRSSVQVRIEHQAEEFLRSSQAHAITLAVVFEGEHFTAHLGELTPHEGDRPNDQTRYEIASITKTLTGTLVARAVLDGVLSLDDDVREHLGAGYDHLAFDGHPITIAHLLTHTSGLPANTKAMDALLAAAEASDEHVDPWRSIYAANRKETREGFLAYLRELVLTEAPGEHFRYSNFGTNLAAHILELRYGMPYAQLLERYVFRAANLSDTTLALDSEHRSLLALGFNADGEQIPPLPIADVLWGADGGLKSTAPDMARYMAWQMSSTARHAERSHRRLHRLDEGYWMGYYWWVIDTERGERSYRHDGGSAGVRNVMILYPSDALAIYAVTNKATGEMNDQLTRLVRQLRNELTQR